MTTEREYNKKSNSIFTDSSNKLHLERIKPCARSFACKASVVGFSVAHCIAQAATIEVTSSSDVGTNCTLREAVLSIDSGVLQPGCVIGDGNFGINDRIIFSTSLADNTITLNDGELALNESVAIDASTISGITVSGNLQSRIFTIDSAEVTIDNLTLENGLVSANNFGGAILIENNSSVILNDTDISNSRARRGGAVNVDQSTMDIRGGRFLNNSATFIGGALSFSDSTVVISNSVAIGNSANESGGALSVFGASSVNLSGVTLSGNSAASNGGAIVQGSYSFLELAESTVTSNSAMQDGGAVRLFLATLSVLNSTLGNNYAEGNGGAISATNYSSLSMSNSTLASNLANNDGGAIHVFQSPTVLLRSTLSNNEAARYGGGVYFEGPFLASFSAANSTFSANSAAQLGGAIFAAQSTTLSLQNSTFSGNTTYTVGGGLFAVSSSVSLSNSIVANSDGGDCFSSSSTVVSDTNSIIEDGGCATDARSIDPILLPLSNNGGMTRTHAIGESSPARDSGDPDTCLTSDQRGAFRGQLCDVGAYEFEEVSFFVIPLDNGRSVVVPL